MFKFLQFLLSLVGHLISKKIKCDVNRNDENVKVQNKLTGLSSILSKWDFLLQLPIINVIQNYRLWKELRKAIKEKQFHDGQNEKDSVMRVSRFKNTNFPNVPVSVNLRVCRKSAI